MTECDHCWPLTAAEAVWVDGDIATQRDRHVHNRFFIRRKSLQTKKQSEGKRGSNVSCILKAVSVAIST